MSKECATSSTIFFETRAHLSRAVELTGRENEQVITSSGPEMTALGCLSSLKIWTNQHSRHTQITIQQQSCLLDLPNWFRNPKPPLSDDCQKLLKEDQNRQYLFQALSLVVACDVYATCQSFPGERGKRQMPRAPQSFQR